MEGNRAARVAMIRRNGRLRQPYGGLSVILASGRSRVGTGAAPPVLDHVVRQLHAAASQESGKLP